MSESTSVARRLENTVIGMYARNLPTIPGKSIIGTNTISVTAVLDMTESLSSRIVKSTAVDGSYQSLVFLVVSSMMTSVRSIAIPNERMSEKLVMKLSDRSIQLRVMIDIKNANGIVRDAMRDSRTPIKKKIQRNTRTIVCNALLARSL